MPFERSVLRGVSTNELFFFFFFFLDAKPALRISPQLVPGGGNIALEKKRKKERRGLNPGPLMTDAQSAGGGR